MNELIILGAGPHANEMADIARHVNLITPTWDFIGFLVPEKETKRVGERSTSGDTVLGTYTDFTRFPDAWFVPEVNCSYLNLPQDRLVSLISPSAFVSGSAQIGKGSVIYPNCFVGHNSILGKRTFILSNSIINHDDHLDDDVIVCSGVSIAGFVNIGTGCYLGQACNIKEYLSIGKNSLIGMGSVVLRDVPPNSVMVGNPAQRLRARID